MRLLSRLPPAPRAPRGPLFVIGVLVAAPAVADTETTLGPGLRLLERSTTSPDQQIVAAYVDLCEAGLVARATTYAERRQTTSAWASDVGAAVAINGAFFSYTDYDAIGVSVGAGELWPTAADWVHGSGIGFASRGRTEIFDAATTLLPAGEDWWREVVPGDPVLVQDGVILSEACYSHMCERHPRTAVGLSADGRTAILVAVDGRSASADGMTRAELAALMVDLGAHDALNLDGGGSTTLWTAAGGVENRPSEGSERIVASHLAFVPGDPQCCTPAAVAGSEGLFGDLPAGHWAIPHAEALYNTGVTAGCSSDPLLFCPDCVPDRATFAVLLQRAAGLPATGAATFTDLAPSDPRAGSVAALADAGLTTGCGGGLFCPDRLITRYEGAVLIARAMGLSPAAATGRFTDLSAEQAPLIEALAAACVTSGCAADQFCPDQELSRAEAAALLNRAFRLDGEDPCAPPDTGGADGEDGVSDGGEDGGADGSADGGADGGVDGGVDGGADGAADGGADGGADGSPTGADTAAGAPGAGVKLGPSGCAAGGLGLLALLPALRRRRR